MREGPVDIVEHLTDGLLLQLFPAASPVHRSEILRQAPDVLDDAGIADHWPRLEIFLAQIGHESAGLTCLSENLRYSAKRLCQVWPRRFPTLMEAEPYAYEPQRLANLVYAERMGNGPPVTGDGWRFRGRGYLQITGKEAYRIIGQTTLLPLIDHPDMVSHPDFALQCAAAVWDWKGLNPHCDRGDFAEVTRILNGGLNGIIDRRAWLAKVRAAFADTDRQHWPAPLVHAVQVALQDHGYYTEVGAADGLMGPKTEEAIRFLRRDRQLGPGTIDEALLTSLDIEYETEAA